MAPSSRFTNTADCLMMNLHTPRYEKSALQGKSGRRGQGLYTVLSLLLSAALAGCATGQGAHADDPLEPFNRVMFTVNDTLDEYLATPVARGYKDVTPQTVRTGVTNFYSNLSDVGNTVNSLLQGDGKGTIESFMRVFVNSIFGVAGLFDLATPAGIEKHPQDFGLTLGRWGIESGPYLVLPLFGPSSFRDSMSYVVDYHFDPITYTSGIAYKAFYSLNFVNVRTNMLGATDILSGAALDRYTFVRDAYMQQRRYLLTEGNGEAKLPVYDDYGDTEEEASQPGVKDGGQAPADQSGQQPGTDPAGTEQTPPEATPEGHVKDDRSVSAGAEVATSSGQREGTEQVAVQGTSSSREGSSDAQTVPALPAGPN